MDEMNRVLFFNVECDGRENLPERVIPRKIISRCARVFIFFLHLSRKEIFVTIAEMIHLDIMKNISTNNLSERRGPGFFLVTYISSLEG